MWKMMFPHVYSHYFDVPQNYRDDIGGNFYVNEMAELRHDLGELRGKPITDDELRHSIEVYNENRRLVRDLYTFRAEKPWQAPAAEVYLMVRAGLVLPVEEHTIMLRDYLAAARAEERPMRDNCRVVLTGMFCEQPPLNLIKSLELSGCYVVDDDLLLVTRWLTGDVEIEGDPLRNLSMAFLHHSESTAAKYEPDQKEKGQHLVRAVKRTAAEGVIFAAPSFCDPALLERPMLQHVLKEAGYRFYALYDKISREDILAHAYAQCRSNKGAPGVDGQDFADIETYGVERWLGELALALRQETYRPAPIRRVFIPKANGKLRPLGISTLWDRVCMTAAMLVLEPIFEADLPPEQYAYRPGRNAQQAVVEVEELLFRGHPEVVDADLADYFGSIPHTDLMRSLARRSVDSCVLHLIKMWLECAVEETDDQGRKRRTTEAKDSGRGIPQGSPITPLTQKIT